MNFLSLGDGIGEIEHDLETLRVDRTRLNISKWKNISAVTKITSWNKKTKI